MALANINASNATRVANLLDVVGYNYRVLSAKLHKKGFSRYCRFYFGVCSSRGNVLD